jgi:hypothetical protein
MTPAGVVEAGNDIRLGGVRRLCEPPPAMPVGR